jgi:excisionase family DNA binding protein
MSEEQIASTIARAKGATDRLFTLKEIEELAGVSRPTVYRWRHEHGLKMVKVGACVRVRESDWIRFLERYTTEKPFGGDEGAT